MIRKIFQKFQIFLNVFKKNIKNISFYKNSDCEEFFNQLIIQIYNSDAYIEKDFNEYINTIMERFESFFRIPPDQRNTYAEKEFLKLFQKISLDLINIFVKCSFTEDFNSTKKDIENYLNNKMANAKQVLSENKNHIKDSFDSIIQDLINNNLKKLSTNIKNKFYVLHVTFNKLKNYACEKGKEINKKYNIENSSLINDIKKIKLSNFVYRHFGVKNFMEIKNQEFIDNIIEVHGFFNTIKNFFVCLFNKDEKLKDNILELKNKLLDRFNTETLSFNNNYDNMQREIFEEFSRTMETQSTDLSKINNEDFEKALDLFVEAKFILVMDRCGNEIELNSDKNDKKDSDNENEEEEEEEYDIELGENITNLINNISEAFNDMFG